MRHGLAEHNAALEQKELSAEEVLKEYAGKYHDSRLGVNMTLNYQTYNVCIEIQPDLIEWIDAQEEIWQINKE